jgi:hypothetical protein
MVTAVPEVLQGSVRDEEPKRQDYADESDNESNMPGDGQDDDLDNEKKKSCIGFILWSTKRLI